MAGYIKQPSTTSKTVLEVIDDSLLAADSYTLNVCDYNMASKSEHPQFPGLPPGMPNPEAVFESWWPIIIAVVAGVLYALRLNKLSNQNFRFKIVLTESIGIFFSKWYVKQTFSKAFVQVMATCFSIERQFHVEPMY